MIDTRNFDRAPLKDIRVKDNQVGIRTPQILISRENGEYMKGDILDANATMIAVKAAMDEAHKGYLPLNGGGTIYKDDKYSTTYITNSGIQFKNYVIASDLYCDSCLYGHKFQLRSYFDENKDFFDRNYYLDTEGLILSKSNSKNDKYYNFWLKNIFGYVRLDKGPQQNCFFSHTYIANPDNGKIKYDAVFSPIFIYQSIRDENENKLSTAIFNSKYVYVEDNGGFISFGSNGVNRMGLQLYCKGILNSDKTKIIYPSVFFNTDGLTDEERKNVGVYISGTTDNDVVASKHGVKTIGKDFPSMDQFEELDSAFKLHNYAYGVSWKVQKDPACTRIGNMQLHKTLPVQSEFKGCVVKDGKLNYWLDPNDWSKKANGESSVLDGTDGDVCVHTPKFYGKTWVSEDGGYNLMISLVKVDNTWQEIPEMYIGAYRCTIHTDNGTTKTATVVNTTSDYRGGGRRDSFDQYLDSDVFKTDLGKPVSNISRATMRKYASNNNEELLCYEYYKWIFRWCPLIEYANFNSQLPIKSDLTSDGYAQGGLGNGVTDWNYNSWGAYNNNFALIPCGYTNELGNFSGEKQAVVDTHAFKVNRYRGFECPFGDIWTNLDGIVIKNNNVYSTTNVDSFDDQTNNKDFIGTQNSESGWQTQLASDNGTVEIIPSAVGGSSSIYMCDYFWTTTSDSPLTLLVGGRAATGSQAGLGVFHSNFGVGAAHSTVGFRTVKKAR